MNWTNIVAKNLKHYRTEAGLSQEQLAFESGLHRTYISSLERGKRNPTIIILGQLADALNIHPSDLLQN